MSERHQGNNRVIHNLLEKVYPPLKLRREYYLCIKTTYIRAEFIALYLFIYLFVCLFVCLFVQS